MPLRSRSRCLVSLLLTALAAGCGLTESSALDTSHGVPADRGQAGAGPAGAGGQAPGGAGQAGAAPGGQAGAGQAGGGGQEPAGWEPPAQSNFLASGHQLFACARFDSGRVKCWGKNGDGQLGLGDDVGRGTSAGDMGPALPFVDLGPGQRAVALAAGERHVCALLAAGQLKCWGQNLGQLGLGDHQTRGDDPGEMGTALPAARLGASVRVKQVAAGSVATCALLSTGRVSCWGYGAAGGLNTYTHTKDIGSPLFQEGDEQPAIELGTDVRVVALAMGSAGSHACVLTDDGRVKCWGLNQAGALGLGDSMSRGTADSEMGDQLPFVDLGAGVRAKAIAVGATHSCALTDDGRIKCWGDNTWGKLGLGDSEHRGDEPGEMGDALPYVDLGAGVKARSVAVGANHTCALLESERVKCWGANWYGQLGLGDTLNRGDGQGQMGLALPAVDLGAGVRARALSLGTSTSCALLPAGRIKCWGNNVGGQLGLGHASDRGGQPADMGDALPTLDLGAP